MATLLKVSPGGGYAGAGPSRPCRRRDARADVTCRQRTAPCGPRRRRCATRRRRSSPPTREDIAAARAAWPVRRHARPARAESRRASRPWRRGSRRRGPRRTRSARELARWTAPERARHRPGRRTLGRGRDHLREPAERHRRRRRLVLESGQRRHPARRLRELPLVARDRRAPGAGLGRGRPAARRDPAPADRRPGGRRRSCCAWPTRSTSSCRAAAAR